jgi:diguanylate cyclase (GGDEF)-like protein
MKRSTRALALILGWSVAAWAAPPVPLHSLRAIHALTIAEAGKALPVAFEATVTYFRGSERTLFVQDGDVGIYVNSPADASLVPGDRVLVYGKTHADFSPDVYSDRVVVLRHGDLPRPIPSSFDELIRTERDCLVVTVHGVVHTIDVEGRTDMRGPGLPMLTQVRAQLLTEGGYIPMFIDDFDENGVSNLLDAEVEVTGTAGGVFDGKMQQTGVVLHVNSIANIRVLHPAAASPWGLPITPMDQILTRFHVKEMTSRVRVHGVITYYHPGSAVVIQSGSRSLWVATQTRAPLSVGAEADAIGFPDAHNGLLALAHAEIHDSQVWAPVQPLPVAWKQLTASHNLFDLVSIEGRVVAAVREASQDEFVLESDHHLFTAIYRHPEIDLGPMKEIPQGAMVRVAGICIIEDSNPFNGDVPFDILMRSFDDIAVVSRPSLVNIRNLMLIVGLLLITVFGSLARGWALERKTRRQTAALATRNEVEADLERRRSRILEDINGSRSLAEVVAEIAALVSFKLDGAPCWCQIDDGTHHGGIQPDTRGLRIVRAEIQARSGPPLGAILAGLNPLVPPCSDESEALAIGAGLATLAIETRRLYFDLTHRSEFDLLTDIHNRFSLDRHMAALLAEAARTGGIFGLIYIDLDDFKQVNDLHGHQAGDLYLQEVSLRMKRQLRAGDMLARLGGDEFAALTPMVRSRADVIEVAVRLERSLDEPFSIDGLILHGSASVGIALFPEDGTTKDSLLSAADAAMYVAKHTRREIGSLIAVPHLDKPDPVDRA